MKSIVAIQDRSKNWIYCYYKFIRI